MTGEKKGTYLLLLMTSVQDADYTPHGSAGSTGGYYLRLLASGDRRNFDEYDTPHSTRRIARRPSFVTDGWFAVQH